ncbi:hypothetical protein [Pseudomonas sp. EL_65y_Pfl2_R96]|uniref:hypothetical protein n=1 Tax=Pseudomonas sp. EL_65y_Pfl2_R96 TaxID=3088699 RepID=UPI0030D7255E
MDREEKYLVISIDTEVDWFDKKTNLLTNVVPSMKLSSEIASRYGFHLTHFCTYEVLNDPECQQEIQRQIAAGPCEIASHLHVWSTPPFQNPNQHQVDEHWIDGFQSELPDDLLTAKLKSLHNKIHEVTGRFPTSHRAGRWAIDHRTMDFLEDNGYAVDSSMTHGVSQTQMKGVSEFIKENDGTCPKTPYYPSRSRLSKPGRSNSYRVLQVPVPLLRKAHPAVKFNYPGKSWFIERRRVQKRALPTALSFRPNYLMKNDDYKSLITSLFKDNQLNVFTMMYHSSELIEGQSPSSKTADRTKQTIARLEMTLELAAKMGIKPLLLSDTPKILGAKQWKR